MELYNTKTRKLEKFKPVSERELKIYYCGPTVYNYAHIGNLRTFMFEDIVVRTMRFLGYVVTTTMSITDVDDKTIRDSIKAGESLENFTKKYTDAFMSDIKKIGIIPADNAIPVTSIIDEMVRMINTMLRRKHAYLSDDGSIYFNIKSFKKYGKMANLDMSGLKESVRIDNDEYNKDSASDFVLWKGYKESDGENFWESEFEISGDKKIVKGRPGWHIECSACAMKYLGPKIDIHMGGVDLIFPHHTNEIAQTESCTRKEFSRYWLHSGHLMVDGKKMSKSLGNFYTLRDLEEKFKNISKSILYRAIRLSFMNSKYSTNLDFSFDKLEANFNTIINIDETIKLVSREIEVGSKKNSGVSRDFREFMQETMQEYLACLEDDFNIPEALAIFYSFLKFVNTNIRADSLSLEELESIMQMFETLNEVLAIFDFDILKKEDIPEKILKKLEDRNLAKENKDFGLADSLRDELLLEGYKIIDSREGSRIEKI